MSSVMIEEHRLKGLFRTPPHIVKALLKREQFAGSVHDPAAGHMDLVRVLAECGYPDVIASDKHPWIGEGCRIEDFLTSTMQADNIVTNPPYHLPDCPNIKLKFLTQAKRLARYKIAMLLPVTFEYTMGYIHHHEHDQDFSLKAVYAFPQTIPWINDPTPGNKMRFAWFVFERG